MNQTVPDTAQDVALIARISAVPALLRIICDNTGMGFAAVARVTDDSWTACAVQDNINFGLKPGGQLELNTTLCMESRVARKPVVIDHASQDPVYFDHHTPRLYNIESYISVPIIRSNGDYFGNLCAIDPRPAVVSDPTTVSMFTSFAALIARQLETEDHQDATERALLDATATADLREQFIAVLGHDLRNPLAAVHMTGQKLARRTAEPDLAQLGKQLTAASRRMSALIDDVLDFTRGRLGSDIGVTMAPVDDLAAAFHDVIAELRLAHPGRSIGEQIGIGGSVRCDRGRLQQLLSNLLSNAINHGATDQPVLVEAAIEGDALVLAVFNDGVPITADDQRRIFEPYWRAPNSDPSGGLGLGLHICSQIVKAHRGNLQVSSADETGTRFVARIPVDPGTTATL